MSDVRRAADNTMSRGNGAIIVFGLPRSGTSWLGKIFDSHPDVLYRHEPDIVDREHGLPFVCPASEVAAYLPFVREYLDRLIKIRTLKAAGPLPVFAKGYRLALGRLLRTGLIVGLRGAQAAIGSDRWPARVPIPDLISKGYRGEPRIVLKSVSSIRYAQLFAEARPDSRIIIIVRHPCGYAASQMRGIALGKFPAYGPDIDLMQSPAAGLLGLRIEQPSTLSKAEQLAWEWAYFNQMALDNVSGMSHVKIVKYEELAADPPGVARELFAFTELSWNAQTEMFIKKSTASDGANRYYGVTRVPLDAANRWRNALSVEDQRRILAIANRVAVGRLFISAVE
jgi:hypothetical protein